MKQFFTSLLILFFFKTSVAQPNTYWLQKAGGITADESLDIASDTNHDFLTTGYITGIANFGTTTLLSAGLSDVYISKADNNGVYKWANNYGGTNDDRGLGVITDNQNNVYATGYFSGSISFGPVVLNSFGQQDIFIVKLNSNGVVQWAKNFGGTQNDIGNAVAVDATGNVYVTGQFVGNATFGSFNLTSMVDPNTTQPSIDVFVCKLDATGTVQWVQKGSAKFTDRALDIVCDNANQIALTGQFSDTITFDQTHNNNLFNSIFIVKFDTNGNEIWFNRAGGGTNNIAYGITNDVADNIYITGDFAGTLIFFGAANVPLNNPYTNKVFIAKYDAAGNLISTHADGSSSEVSAHDIKVDASQNAYIVGTFNCKFSQFADSTGQGTFNSAGYKDIFVAKYDATLNRLWMQQSGSKQEDEGKSITLDANNNMVIAGSYNSSLFFPYSDDFITSTDFSALINGTIYCSDPNYASFAFLTGLGNSDIFFAKGFDLDKPPYDYYNRSGSLCDKPYVGVEVSPDSIKVCGEGFLTSNTNTLGEPGPSFNYSWSNSKSTDAISIATTGNYWVTQTSSDGCFVSSDTVFATIYPYPSLPLITDSKGVNIMDSITTRLKLCAPDTLFLTATVAPGLTFNGWNGPCGNSQTLVDTVVLTGVSCSGVYVCTVTDQNGCQSSNLLQVDVQEKFPQIQPYLKLKEDLNNDDTLKVCNNYFVIEIDDSLLNACIDEIDSVLWTVSPVTPFSSSINACSYGVFNVANSGAYTVTAIVYRYNLCDTQIFSLTKNVYIIVGTPAAINVSVSGYQYLCPTGDTLTLTATGSSNYLWNGPGIISNPNLAVVQVNLIGSYSVSVTDTSIDGCIASGIYGYEIFTTPQPSITMSPANGLVCPNDSVFLIATPGVNYNWQGPNGPINSNVISVYATTPGFYNCIVTDSVGCTLISNTVESKQYATPLLIASPSAVLCNGDSVTINAATNDGSTVQWNSPLSGNSLTQVIYTPGTYTCSIISCGITTQASVTIVASSVNAPILVTGSTEFCEGDSVVLTGPSAMSNYNWQPGNITTQALTVFNAGTYTLAVTDIGGCTANSQPITILVKPKPATPVITGNGPVCSGSDVVLNTNSIAGFTYNWSGPLSFTSTLVSPVISNISTAQAGNYLLEVVDSTNCKSDKAVLNIIVDTLFPLPIITNGTVCLDSMLNLYSNTMAGANYSWSGPNNFTSTDANPTLYNFQKSDTGLYKLLVIFGQCNASATKEINYQICSAAIPNVMTPNGDGLNDFFQPANYDLESIQCKIYDRWGVLMAEWTNLNGYWDGKNQFTNKDVPEGVYFFIINMQPINSELKSIKGFIQLFRD